MLWLAFAPLAIGLSKPCKLVNKSTQHCVKPRWRASTSMTNRDTEKSWQCMSNCGACCKLGEFDEDVLRDMLKSPEDVVEYLGMVGSDGWCIWFDSGSRKCKKYNERPRFCRATPEVFEELYHVPQQEFNEFAIQCCTYHIANIYGEESHEAYRYESLTSTTFEHIQQVEGALD